MTLAPHGSDALVLRKAFAHVPSSVAALAASIDGEDQVLVASSFTVGVSMVPPLVLFSVQHTSSTWPVLRRARTLGVSVLGQGQGPLAWQLAGKDRAMRWHGVSRQHMQSGGIVLNGASVVLECRLYQEVPAGDHDIVVLEVLTLKVDHDSEPLVFHGSRFRGLAG